MPTPTLLKERNPKKLKLNRPVVVQNQTLSFNTSSFDSFSNYKFPSYSSQSQSQTHLNSPLPLSPTSTFGLFPSVVTESTSDLSPVEGFKFNPTPKTTSEFEAEAETEVQHDFIPSSLSYDHNWIVRLGLNISKIGDRNVSNGSKGRIDTWREGELTLRKDDSFDPLDNSIGRKLGESEDLDERTQQNGIFSRKSSLAVFHDSFEYDTTTTTTTSSPFSNDNRKFSTSSSSLTGGTFSAPYSPIIGRQDSLRSSIGTSCASFSPKEVMNILPRDMRFSIISNEDDDFEIAEDLKSLKVFSIIRKMFVS